MGSKLGQDTPLMEALQYVLLCSPANRLKPFVGVIELSTLCIYQAAHCGFYPIPGCLGECRVCAELKWYEIDIKVRFQ